MCVYYDAAICIWLINGMKKNFVNSHGINLIFSCILTIISIPCLSKEPTPHFVFSLYLVKSPQPLTPDLTLIPMQQGLVRSLFRLNLKPYVTIEHTDFSYELYNGSKDLSQNITTGLYGTSLTILGLPPGIKQITTKPEDCSFPFNLWFQQRCQLHFDVDPNTVLSSQNSFGPQVYMHMDWYWGNQQNRHGGENIWVLPSQTITGVLAPVLLPLQIHVTPNEQNGLFYDATTHSIQGTPIKTGEYYFNVYTSIGNINTTSKTLTVQINSIPFKLPMFKQNYRVPSATSNRTYQLNLMDLIEPDPHLINNQIHFHLIPNHESSWLNIDKKNPALLTGHLTPKDAGLIKKVNIMMTSNTNHDSALLRIEIPVAYDLEKKPMIKTIQLNGIAGHLFEYDFKKHILDSTNDHSLQIIIDKITPAAPWLYRSKTTPTQIRGFIPHQPDRNYLVTVHANTAIGGNSDLITLPLHIVMDNTQPSHQDNKA